VGLCAASPVAEMWVTKKVIEQDQEARASQPVPVAGLYETRARGHLSQPGWVVG